MGLNEELINSLYIGGGTKIRGLNLMFRDGLIVWLQSGGFIYHSAYRRFVYLILWLYIFPHIRVGGSCMHYDDRDAMDDVSRSRSRVCGMNILLRSRNLREAGVAYPFHVSFWR